MKAIVEVKPSNNLQDDKPSAVTIRPPISINSSGYLLASSLWHSPPAIDFDAINKGYIDKRIEILLDCLINTSLQSLGMNRRGYFNPPIIDVNGKEGFGVIRNIFMLFRAIPELYSIAQQQVLFLEAVINYLKKHPENPAKLYDFLVDKHGSYLNGIAMLNDMCQKKCINNIFDLEKLMAPQKNSNVPQCSSLCAIM